MKKVIFWILGVLLLAGLVFGASRLYTRLQEDWAPDISDILTTAPAVESPDVPPESTAPANADAAPDFTVYDADGNAVHLSDFRGKPVVLNFWATWCYYCKEEMPDFDAASQANPDIQFMMVDLTDGHSETPENAKAFIESNGFTFPVFYDTDMDAASKYPTNSIPVSFFIDRDGNVVTYAPGMMSAENLDYALSLIR